MFITVFTPTFNRGDKLKNLYNSLTLQTFIDFEWLIVDDGSIDNTTKEVETYIKENKIDIKYIKTENQGKHKAINEGVKYSRGELFFIVDSDDWLTNDALQTIFDIWNSINPEQRKNYSGVTGLRQLSNGKKIGLIRNFEILDSNDIEIKKYIKGDKAHVFRNDLMKSFPFPEFENEKFLSESIVWYRLAQKFKVRYFNKAIYYSEFLDDGLTKNVWKNHRQSPKGSMLLFKERIKFENNFLYKIKGAINYYRSIIKYKVPLQENLKIESYWKLFYIIGLILFYIDIYKEKLKK